MSLIVNFEQNSHIVLVSNVDFEKVTIGYVFNFKPEFHLKFWINVSCKSTGFLITADFAQSEYESCCFGQNICDKTFNNSRETEYHMTPSYFHQLSTVNAKTLIFAWGMETRL